MDKHIWLCHAVTQGGLIFEEDNPIIPLKSTPLQVHISELMDNAGRIDPTTAAENHDFAAFLAGFFDEQGLCDENGNGAPVRELLRLLRYYETNAIPVRDEVTNRVVAKGLFLSTSL